MHLVLIHGLGVGPWMFLPFSWSLCRQGYTIQTPHYPSRLCASLNDATLYVSSQLNDLPLDTCFIGFSFGGLIACELAKIYPNIKLVLTICTPLRCVSVLKYIEYHLPTIIASRFKTPLHDLLRNMEPIIPPKTRHVTIGTTLPLLETDGCVRQEETMFDPLNHIHIPMNSHWTFCLDPRLWWCVAKLIGDDSQKS
jgi:hypothetical protein